MHCLTPTNGPLFASAQRILLIPTLQQVVGAEQQNYLRSLDFCRLSSRLQTLIPYYPHWERLQPAMIALGEAQHAGHGTCCNIQHKASLLLHLLKVMDNSGHELTGGVFDSLETYFSLRLPEEFIVYAPEPDGDITREPDTFIAVADPVTRIIPRPRFRRFRNLLQQWRQLSRNRWGNFF